MLSRLQAKTNLLKGASTFLHNAYINKPLQNITLKRWSGHNNMEIRPQQTDYHLLKNWVHFYMLLGLIPATVITTIVNIRANPELSEVPDGYEPRYWEFYKNPITRTMAKYLYNPVELDHEVLYSYLEYSSEADILKKIVKKCEKVMKFYNDHRSMFYMPYYADYFRMGRDSGLYGPQLESSNMNTYIDISYNPDFGIVPVEGYPEGPITKD